MGLVPGLEEAANKGDTASQLGAGPLERVDRHQIELELGETLVEEDLEGRVLMREGGTLIWISMGSTRRGLEETRCWALMRGSVWGSKYSWKVWSLTRSLLILSDI